MIHLSPIFVDIPNFCETSSTNRPHLRGWWHASRMVAQVNGVHWWPAALAALMLLSILGSFRAMCFLVMFFDWFRKRASTGRALAQLNLCLFHLQRTSWWWCRPPKQSFKPMQDPLQESSSRVILWTSDEWSGKKQSGHRIDILEESHCIFTDVCLISSHFSWYPLVYENDGTPSNDGHLHAGEGNHSSSGGIHAFYEAALLASERIGFMLVSAAAPAIGRPCFGQWCISTNLWPMVRRNHCCYVLQWIKF